MTSGCGQVEALAVECTLAEVKPTQAMLGRWDERAIEALKHMALEQVVIGSVYSVSTAQRRPAGTVWGAVQCG